MLKSLFNDFNNHRLIVIEDTSKNNADELFMALLSTAQKLEPQNVFLLCTEKSTLTYTSKLPSPIKSYDLLTTFITSDPQEFNMFEKLSLPSIINDLKEKTIFIDSVNQFIWDCEILFFLKDLLKYMDLGFNFIVRIHSDALFEEFHLKSLLYYCTAHIKVVDTWGCNKFKTDTILKKTCNKFERKTVECVCFGDNYEISVLKEDIKREKPQQTSVSINSLTTFNLGTNMSKTEKLARENLVLPYLRTSENDGALITYEADEADLEEDPDEDLEL